MKRMKTAYLAVVVAFGTMWIAPKSNAVTIFADNFESYTPGATLPAGPADAGTWDAATAWVIADDTQELQLFGPANRRFANGTATQSSPLGTPLHFEFDVDAGQHNNGNVLYQPEWFLWGPTTADIIVGVRLNYAGNNGSPPAFESPIEAWDGAAWVPTGLIDPLNGWNEQDLYEIDYTVGASSFTLTVEGVGSTNVPFVGSTTEAVLGVGATVRGTSSYSESDNFLLRDGDAVPEPPIVMDISVDTVEAISFQTEAGTNYVLESSSNDVDWASTRLEIQGDGTTMLVTDPAGSLSPSLTYRILEE